VDDHGGVLYLVVSRRAYPAASLIEQAMMGYGAPGPLDDGAEPGPMAGLDFLRAQARSAYQAYQATRYDTTGHILPGLIRGVETAARTARSASAAACAVRARVYDTTAALLSRVGEPFLARQLPTAPCSLPSSPAIRCSPQPAPGGCLT